MKKNKKLFLIIGAILAAILIIVGIFLYVSFKPVDYYAPVSSLKASDPSISRNTLVSLNQNFEKALVDKYIEDRELVYYPKTYSRNDNQYIGYFISDEDFVYQFTFDLETKHVKLIEYAKSYSIIKYQVETSNNTNEDAG